MKIDQEKNSPYSRQKTKAEINQQLSRALDLIKSDPDLVLQISEQAAAACQLPPFNKKPYLAGLARSYYARASVYLERADYGQAMRFYSDSLSIYQTLKDHKQIASQLNNIGIVFAYCGAYDGALKNMLAAEKYISPEFSPEFKAEIYNNIGYTYLALGDYQAAIPFLLNSLQTAQSLDSEQSAKLTVLANIYDSLCQAYLAMKELEPALQSGIRSVDCCRQNHDHKKESEYLISLGEVYLLQENFPQAQTCFQAALQIARDHSFRREEADALRQLGELHNRQEHWEMAVELLQAALVIAREIKILREVYECLYALANIFKSTGQFEKALEHFEQFHQLKEIVFNDQSDQRIKNLTMIHQLEQAHQETLFLQQKGLELQHEIEERRRAQELAELISRTDPLTGTFNRGYFFARVQQHISESGTKREPFSILIMDLDHFKQVNDTYGHLEGDRTLISIATRINQVVRKDDIVGRFGGEEFVVFLPRTNLEIARTIAERIRLAIEALELSPSLPELRVTVSIGLTSLQAGDKQEDLLLEQILYRADQALYLAKNQGRNQVCISTQEILQR